MSTVERSRRTFLSNVALMSVAAPFVHALEARAAEAPRRLVLLFSGNGHRRGQWARRRTDMDFDLLRITAPLAPFKAQTLLFQGLDMHAMRKCKFNTVKHGLGSGIAFTGMGVMNDGWPAGPSVDQLVAARVGSGPPIRSLHLGAGCHDTNVYGRVAYAAASKPIVPEQSPQAAYARLFAPVLGATSPNTTDEVTRRLARRQSVLDTARADVCRLASVVGAADRRKLDAHCEGLRSLERQLAMPPSNNPTPPTCEKLANLAAGPTNNANYEKLLNDQIALVRTALACRLTNVVTLQLGQAAGSVVATQAGSSLTHHHNASHWKSSGGGEEAYIRISVWYAGRVAALLGALAAVDEGDGASLLDNTALAWGTDVNEGEEHGDEDVPWAVFGGRKLGIRGGRMVSVTGHHHNELLLALAHAAGATELRTVGHADLCPGPLNLG